MTLASLLLLALGVLGALDILFFHMLAQDLRSRPQSRHELVTHALRGPTYFVLFLAVPNATPSGAFAWALLAVLVFDAGVSAADFWLEPESRRSVGGLPRGEYLLHVGIAILYGALVLAIAQVVVPRLGEPTSLGLGETAVPWLLRLVLAVMAPIALASSVLDALAVRRLASRPERRTLAHPAP